MKLTPLFLLLACASKPCRVPEGQAIAMEAKPHIFVAKSDGALQCQPGSVDVKDMEPQLAGIKVYSRNKQSDGKIRVQMCGTSAGKFNVFEIDANNLDRAKKAGFKEWKP